MQSSMSRSIQDPFFYGQAADLYARLFVQNPDKLSVVFSEEEAPPVQEEEPVSALITFARSDTVEVILFEEDEPLVPLRELKTSELIVYKSHPISCFLEESNGTTFIERCQDLFHKKYPKPIIFDPLILRRHLITSLIKGLHDKEGFVFRGTLNTRGLSEEERQDHCQAVAIRVYGVVSEILGPSDFMLVDEEVTETLSRLYTQEACRLLRRRVPQEFARLQDSWEIVEDLAATVKSCVKADLRDRFFNPKNREIKTLLNEEISYAVSGLEDGSIVCSPTPEEYLDFLIKARWNDESCAKKQREDATEEGLFFRTCKQDFLENFPQHEFLEDVFLSRYIEIASQCLLVSKGVKRNCIGLDDVQLEGLSVKKLEQTAQLILNRVLDALDQDFGKGTGSIPLIRGIVAQKIDDLYIDLLKNQALFIVKSRVAGLIIQGEEIGHIRTQAALVMLLLKNNFPFMRLWDSVGLNINKIVLMEFIKNKSVALLRKHLEAKELAMPDFIKLENGLIIKDVFDQLISETPEPFCSNEEFCQEIQLYIKNQLNFMNKIPTVNESTERLKLMKEEALERQSIKIALEQNRRFLKQRGIYS